MSKQIRRSKFACEIGLRSDCTKNISSTIYNVCLTHNVFSVKHTGYTVCLIITYYLAVTVGLAEEEVNSVVGLPVGVEWQILHCQPRGRIRVAEDVKQRCVNTHVGKG